MIETKLTQMLAGLEKRNGKNGVSVTVVMPEVDEANQNLRALNGMLVVNVSVVENVMVNMGANGTGLSAEEVALRVAALLQHRSFAPGRVLMADGKLITPKPESLVQGKVEYVVRMKVPFALAAPALVATPGYHVDGASLTLTCETSGAAIYYTLDGSYPGPGNAAAVLYAGPVTLEEGAFELRAAGHKAGLAASGERQVAGTVE